MKAKLRWTAEDDVSSDASGWTLLKFASMANNAAAVRALLLEAEALPPRTRARLLESVSRHGVLYLSVPANARCLHLCIWLGATHALQLLLAAKAEPHARDGTLGADPFSIGAAFGQLPAIDLWLGAMPEWNLNRQSRASTGGMTALHWALFWGPTTIGPLIERLLDPERLVSADPKQITSAGRSVLTSACLNEDYDPEVLRDLCRRLARLAVDSLARAAAHATRQGASGLQCACLAVQAAGDGGGAALAWLSQYPLEGEHAWPPLTRLTTRRASVDAATGCLVVEAAAS